MLIIHSQYTISHLLRPIAGGWILCGCFTVGTKVWVWVSWYWHPCPISLNIKHRQDSPLKLLTVAMTYQSFFLSFSSKGVNLLLCSRGRDHRAAGVTCVRWAVFRKALITDLDAVCQLLRPHTHTHTRTCMWRNTHTHMHVNTHKHTHTRTDTHRHTHTHTHMRTHAQIHTHTETQTHTQTHSYTHTMATTPQPPWAAAGIPWQGHDITGPQRH